MSKTNLYRVKEELTIDDLVWILDFVDQYHDKYVDEYCEVSKNFNADDSSTWNCNKEGKCKDCIKEWLEKKIDDEPIKDVDNVNHPKHYTTGKIECIAYIEDKLTPEEFRGYIKGNAIKYITRERNKGGDEDLKKTKWYLDRLIEKLEKKEEGKESDTERLQVFKKSKRTRRKLHGIKNAILSRRR